MHASAAECLLPFLSPGSRVLDVGSGSGYLTAVFAELASPPGAPEGGRVVGMEHIPELKELGEKNFAKGDRGRQMLEEGKVAFVVGDGRKGWKEQGGEEWDAIHVGAAADELHLDLVEQLKRPGR
jgi:protein-L-isoaspartate(D-aspartate) O-methyltransferase